MTLKCKPARLNSRGIAHFILPLFVVVAIAAVGTYVLVNSKADSIPASTSKIEAESLRRSGKASQVVQDRSASGNAYLKLVSNETAFADSTSSEYFNTISFYASAKCANSKQPTAYLQVDTPGQGTSVTIDKPSWYEYKVNFNNGVNYNRATGPVKGNAVKISQRNISSSNPCEINIDKLSFSIGPFVIEAENLERYDSYGFERKGYVGVVTDTTASGGKVLEMKRTTNRGGFNIEYVGPRLSPRDGSYYSRTETGPHTPIVVYRFVGDNRDAKGLCTIKPRISLQLAFETLQTSPQSEANGGTAEEWGRYSLFYSEDDRQGRVVNAGRQSLSVLDTDSNARHWEQSPSSCRIQIDKFEFN